MVSEGTVVPVEDIQSRILFIRGEKVMLDADLAALYGVETRALVQAVKRNVERFPDDFMFQLTPQGVRQSEITICDLKAPGPRRAQVSSVCLYRARRRHAQRGPEPRHHEPEGAEACPVSG